MDVFQNLTKKEMGKNKSIKQKTRLKKMWISQMEKAGYDD